MMHLEDYFKYTPRRDVMHTFCKRMYLVGRWNDKEQKCLYYNQGYRDWVAKINIDSLYYSPPNISKSCKLKHNPVFICKVFVTFEKVKTFSGIRNEVRNIKFTKPNHWQKMESMMQI